MEKNKRDKLILLGMYMGICSVSEGANVSAWGACESPPPIFAGPGAQRFGMPAVYEETPVDESDGLPKIQEVITKLNEKIIGQEKPMRSLATSWHAHAMTQKLNRILGFEGGSLIEKTNILLVGPTGSGKTASVQLLAQIVKCPYYVADASVMTRTGYEGYRAESVVAGLLRHADYDVEKAENGIIFIDEIDKKASKDYLLESGVATADVQAEFLKLLEGKKVSVPVPTESGGSHSVEVDTSKILFIAGGAFSRLPKKGVLAPEDIVSYGFTPEFVGRFGKLIQLWGMTEENLFQILKTPYASPLQERLLLLERGYHIHVRFEESVLMTLSKQAFKMGMGVRGLKKLIGEIIDPIIQSSDTLRGGSILINDAYMQRSFPHMYTEEKSTLRHRILAKVKQWF